MNRAPVVFSLFLFLCPFLDGGVEWRVFRRIGVGAVFAGDRVAEATSGVRVKGVCVVV